METDTSFMRSRPRTLDPSYQLVRMKMCLYLQYIGPDFIGCLAPRTKEMMNDQNEGVSIARKAQLE